MDPLTVDITEAVMSAHDKAADVRAACVVYDLGMLKLRQKYYLDPEPASWAQGLASRLEILNKERRKARRIKLRSVQDGLQKLLTMPAGEAGIGMDEDRQESLASTLEPRLGQTIEDATGSNTQVNSSMTLMLDAGVTAALERCARMHDLFQTFDQLYDAGVKCRTLALQDRVLLHRARPRMQKSADSATELRKNIESITEEWWPYIEILMSETELEAILKTMHDMKIPCRAFLEQASPVCEELVKLYGIRNSIVKEVINLKFRHETDWLALRDRPLYGYKYRFEMKKYEDLLTRAHAQRPSYDSALLAVKKLDDWASSPAVVRSARGADISIARLFEAEEKVRELHRTVNAMTELVEPSIVSLEQHVNTLSRASQQMHVFGQNAEA